jgi:MFS family permease
MTLNDDPSVSTINSASVAVEPQKPLGRRFLVLYGLVNFGLYLTVMMPALFSLPFKIQLLAPDQKSLALGLVAAVGAVVGLVAGPAAGVLSDRTHSRWGRRRPWLLGGILVVLAGSLVVAVSGSLPMLLFGWVIVSVGTAGCTAAITPVVAERVPESQRGIVSAIVGVATQLGGVMGYVIGGMLTGNLVLMFAIPVIVLAVFAAIYMIAIPDSGTPLQSATIRETFRLMVFNPAHHRDFSLVWVGKFLMQTSLAFLTTYQLYFLSDRLGFSAAQAGQKLALVGGIGVLVTMTFAIASGTVSDRLKRRKVFVASASALCALGLVLMAFTTGFGLFFAAVMCVLGAAGMFGASDVAMASDLVPDRSQSGRWMTIYNLAASLPSAIAPLIGSAVLLIGSTAGGNYTALFLLGGAVALGTGVVTLFVRGVR